jgi:hypothetical protein
MSEEQPGASHREGPIRMICMTRLIVLILALIIASGSPAAARCCSLGGGASYDYLGDSSMDIGMSSYGQLPPPKGEGLVPGRKSRPETIGQLTLTLNAIFIAAM